MLLNLFPSFGHVNAIRKVSVIGRTSLKRFRFKPRDWRANSTSENKSQA